MKERTPKRVGFLYSVCIYLYRAELDQNIDAAAASQKQNATFGRIRDRIPSLVSISRISIILVDATVKPQLINLFCVSLPFKQFATLSTT